ncbi:MAG: hypothetical protein Q4B67_06280 [Eubacteriales bacterium]|nr:hypothetical protein [Eubacteriales bacterium]
MRASAVTHEQFDALIAIPAVEAIYLDACFFMPEEYKELCDRAHKGKGGIGKLIVLKLPNVWREKAEAFFERYRETVLNAGFDGFMAGSIEGVLWLSEAGAQGDIILDHTIYNFNSLTDEELSEVTGLTEYETTYSVELNNKELNRDEAARELIVYGRTPLMYSAQCIRRTALRCDKREQVMYLKDRTGAVMPVRNACRFCYNIIYNSVPTVIYDLEDEILAVNPSSVRYEFTTENEKEIKNILSGAVPKAFTRGHFHRGAL